MADSEGEDHDSEDDVESARSMPTLASPVVSGWRGLAHYRTWSRRRVFQKSCEERTASELYLLEETVTDVKLIGDLPLSKRLEYIDKESPATSSISCLLGLSRCKATKVIEGVQDDEISVYGAGHWFGEAALELDTCIREATCVTAERSELLTLTKDDYFSVLKIPKTPELKARVQYLKSIGAFSDVSKQSLRRLANVLTARTFNKNRVITFQGDDAVEMFFIRTGGCRVIMEIHDEKTPPILPRASSSLSQYRPTRHHRCKQEAQDRKKEWWRPSFISRPHTRGSGLGAAAQRCASVPTGVPLRLPNALLANPDMIHQLIKIKPAAGGGGGRRSATPSSGGGGHGAAGCSTQCRFVGGGKDLNAHSAEAETAEVGDSSAQMHPRPSTAPAPQTRSGQSMDHGKSEMGIVAAKRKGSVTGSEDGRPLSPWGASEAGALTRAATRASNVSSQGHRASFAESCAAASTEQPGSRPGSKYSRPASSVGGVSARFKCPSMMQQRHKASHHPGKRRSSTMKQKYSLKLFLKECEDKEKAQKQADMEFSEKDHRLWQMGDVTTGMMPSVMLSNENLYYQQKFEKWAKNVINRERKLLSYNKYAGTPAPSFLPGIASSGILRLEQATPDRKRTTPEETTGSKSIDEDVDTSILDIGALHAGQYFGERGLLTATRRAASIVAVTVVETLVLNKWDFHRHCDRDVIKALSKHDYQKEEHIFKLYLKTRKWELFKRQVVEDVFKAKKNRIDKTTGPRAVRVVPKADAAATKELPLKEWAY